MPAAGSLQNKLTNQTNSRALGGGKQSHFIFISRSHKDELGLCREVRLCITEYTIAIGSNSI